MADKKPADGKRQKISKAQQHTLLEVLGASLVLGTCIVLSIFMIKYINFNTKIISAKSEAIGEYDETLRNVGICADSDGNKRLNDKEIENCNPGSSALKSGTLRYNILVDMAENVDLESVARQRDEDCYNANGERINFRELYEDAENEFDRERYLQMEKVCSALRVIPDALPAQKNTEALMASLDQIFILTGWEPERLAPSDDVVESPVEGTNTIPVTMRVEGPSDVVLRALNNVERSIREFDLTTSTIEWTNQGLSLQATANAYYLSDLAEIEETETIYASRKARSVKK